MSNPMNSASVGLGFVGVLTIVFVVLKITKVLCWSWWWVLAPVWVSAIIIIIITILAVGLLLHSLRGGW